MNENEKKEMIERYQKRLAAHGNSVAALSSGNEERQEVRFKNLSSIGCLDGTSILDFGCGLGDFFGYLEKNGITVDYTGIDIVPEFIAEAKQKYPKANFIEIDLLKSNDLIGKEFDYIFCSQVFNRKLTESDNVDYAQALIKKLFTMTRKGIAVDFVTSYVDFKEDHLFYYSPEEMYKFSKSLTKMVTLKSDYPLYEFMLFIYQDFKGWRR